ncbi:MAG: hypothetical protein M3P95_06525 [Actinomycetota bacterium]|nr:hypothetical protein [Actinomycetota bacterium]
MLRLLLTPRWLLRSALAVVVAGAFVWLGLWQWDRAHSSTGRGTNVAYAIEWFVFAGFVFFCLWHWLKDSREAEDESEAPPAPAPPPLPHRARPVPAAAPAVDPGDDPELAAYNAHLARLDAEARRGQRR